MTNRIVAMKSGIELPDGFGFEDNGKHYVVERESEHDGTFHRIFAARFEYDTGTVYYVYHSEPYGYVYGPLAPGTETEDVDGARYAWDDGTYWHFAHCSPKEQHDFAAAVRTFTVEQLSIAISKAQVKVAEATNANARSTAIRKAKALVKFAEAAGANAHSRVIGATLGHYHRNPHHDHKREVAVVSIGAVLSEWEEAGRSNTVVRAEYQAVNADASAIKTALEATHTIETRLARIARLKRESAAKGVDPVDGYEYVYTLVATQAAITEANRLPDADWHFDAAPVGGFRLASGQVYQDAEPTRTVALPFIIRFKRRLPAGADLRPGRSIGSVAWEQEPAY